MPVSHLIHRTHPVPFPHPSGKKRKTEIPFLYSRDPTRNINTVFGYFSLSIYTSPQEWEI